MKRLCLCVGLSLLVVGFTGCAAPNLGVGINRAVDKYESRNAAALRAPHHPQYRFDIRLRSDLEDAAALTDLAAMKQQSKDVLMAAREQAVDVDAGEIDRMDPEGIASLVKHYCPTATDAPLDEQRGAIKKCFAAESETALQTDLAQLQAAEDLRSARRILARIERDIEAPVGDRGKLGRALLTAPLFLPAAIGAEIADEKATKQVIDASFGHVFVYRPANGGGAKTAAQLEAAEDHQLAEWFATVFIQQHDPEAPFSPSEDQFGKVRLAGTPEDIEVHIDIERPTVYWTVREAKLETHEYVNPLTGARSIGSSQAGPQKRTQLVYVAWYPSRPALKSGDNEAGLIDGVVIRITLDQHHRPAIYEFVRSCGCYHMLYVAEFVEAEARAQFGEPLPGMKYALQKSDMKRELFIPSLVGDDGSHPVHPIAFVSSGQHMLMGVEASEKWLGDAAVSAEHTYVLEPYESLSHLPLGDGVASMFGSDGLVHKAGRAEGWLLAPTGMRSAGQPRQLGTMKIRMDAYDYDDPYLLDRQFRFPSDF